MTKHKYLIGFTVLALAAMTAVACASQAPAASPTQATKASEPAKPASTAAPAPQPTAAAKAAPTASNAVAKPVGWPTKPITMIVPWDAGGGSDIGIRLLMPLMETQLGTSIQVVNKPGAGSQTGLTELAIAKPDGYTIANTSIPATVTIALDEERKSAFKVDGFSHVGLHVYDPGIVAVQPESKYKTLMDVLEDAKARPGQVKAGTTGILGDDHLAILQLQKLTGAKFAIVHFTGGAPQQAALLGGHIDVAFNNVGDFAKHHIAGKARIVTIMDKERSKFIKDVSTAEEQGIKLYSGSARSISAPKDTPKEIVWAMSRAMEEAMKNPEHVKKMDEQSLALKYMNPDEFTKYWMDFAEQVKPLMPLAREN